MTDRVWVLLLAAVNVGGRSLKMADLRAALERAGCSGVQTYLQSGNAVVCWDRTREALIAAVRREIAAGTGLDVALLVLTTADLGAALAANPWPGADNDPKPMHLYFHDGPGPADAGALDALRQGGEDWRAGHGVVYLRAPEGIGRSKLAARLARAMRGTVTARNLRTCAALQKLAAEA